MNNIKEYIDKGIDYNAYEKDMLKVINAKSDEALDLFYALNLKRMQRLQKKITLNEVQLNQLKQLNKNITLVTITEGWCGDAAQVIPMIQLLVANSEHLEEKFMYRDQNPALINQYLTNGGQAIPIVLGVDQSGEVLFKWGPRPAFGDAILKEYKAGKLSKDDFILTLQKQYNKDKGQSILNELIYEITNA